MKKEQLYKFVSKQKIAFISSVDEQGYPVTRAMLSPRKIDGNDIYFSTNTSSKKVTQYLNNDKACVYFYRRGVFRYRGLTIKGTMTVCMDQPTKNDIWRPGDKIFYKKGVTDPDYCVLKFTGTEAEYYCDFKVETFDLNKQEENR
ncbi:MAG: pyridoxamine 5'-phosphate oxidase family protein [Clostridia bacterium]|nr:pyridoxamine 5'-phosphate oxidase family protein [Clostridia bacterium]